MPVLTVPIGHFCGDRHDRRAENLAPHRKIPPPDRLDLRNGTDGGTAWSVQPGRVNAGIERAAILQREATPESDGRIVN
jgi:hypothetical protein